MAADGLVGTRAPYSGRAILAAMNALPSSLQAELAAQLGDGWLTDPSERLAYAYDNSRRQALPDAVALPTTREQVHALVRACRAQRVPVIARGRGTNTTGASVPVAGGVVVSFERMDRILAIRPGDRCAVVEPGVLNGDLQPALHAHGLFWPPDPTSAGYSTVGGNLACNAGGPRAVKYGASRDNVLALTAVTGAGELVACGTRHHQGRDRLRPSAPAGRHRRHARADRRSHAATDATAAGATRAACALSRCRQRRARGGANDGAAGDAVDARIHGRATACAGARVGGADLPPKPARC